MWDIDGIACAGAGMDLTQIDPWLFVAGLGFFLFGMQRLEAGLRLVSGDALERVLQRSTGNPLGSILVGVAATAVLQSSSLVGLMVLAFVGAGVLRMRNAVGVILGSNLGTTFTGWLVTTLGFKLHLDELALPLLAVGTLGVVFMERRPRWSAYATLTLGLGLLLFGLGFMKDSVDAFAQSMDFSAYTGASPYWFFVIGFCFAAIIQSSSATMVITLSALDAGIISLPAAAGIAIGADLGTTSTVMLASLRGAAAERQVALAHFLFNMVTDLIALFVLLPFIGAGVALAGITDPLFGLVAFHSFFNVVGIGLFLPFIVPFSRFLESRFRQQSDRVSHYLGGTPPQLSAPALQALHNEVGYRIGSVIELNAQGLGVALPTVSAARGGAETEPAYARLKQAEGEAMDYARALLGTATTDEHGARVTQLLTVLRESVYSSKSVNDIRPDLDEFARVGREPVVGYMKRIRAHQATFYQGVESCLTREAGELAALEHGNAEFIRAMIAEFYRDEHGARLSDVQSSTFLNILREVDASNRALLRAVSALLEVADPDVAVVSSASAVRAAP